MFLNDKSEDHITQKTMRSISSNFLIQQSLQESSYRYNKLNLQNPVNYQNSIPTQNKTERKVQTQRLEKLQPSVQEISNTVYVGKKYSRKLQPANQESSEVNEFILDSRVTQLNALQTSLTAKLEKIKNDESSLSKGDTQQIYESLTQMLETIQKVSLFEIKANKTLKNNEVLQIENKILSNQIISLKKQLKYSEKENITNQQRIKNLENEILTARQTQIKQEKTIDDLSQSLQRSEDRLKLVLETNSSVSQSSVRNSIQVLIKENEQNKKVNIDLTRQLTKLQSQYHQLQFKFQKVTKKINQLDFDQFLKINNYINFQFTQIPKTTDYKLSKLTKEHQCIFFSFYYQFLQVFINSITELSPDEFYSLIQQIESIPVRQQQIGWLFQQFIDSKQFNENQNKWIRVHIIQNIQKKKVSKIQFVQTLNELIKTIGKFGNHIEIMEVNLWIRDENTGVFYTLKELQPNDYVIKRAICARGIFKDCCDSQLPILNMDKFQKHIMYQIENSKESDVLQNSTFVIPVIYNNITEALIEFHNPTKNFDKSTFDLQYFGSLITTFCSVKIQEIKAREYLEKRFKQREILLDEFFVLVQSNTPVEFVQKVQGLRQKLSYISSLEVIFVQRNEEKINLIRYLKNGSKVLYKQLIGIVGQAVEKTTTIISKYISKEGHFNGSIDLDSILPVYTHPVLVDSTKKQQALSEDEKYQKVAVAVLQFTISKKMDLKKRSMKSNQIIEQIQGEYSSNYLENLSDQHGFYENEVKIFCDFVGSAYKLIRDKINNF